MNVINTKRTNIFNMNIELLDKHFPFVCGAVFGANSWLFLSINSTDVTLLFTVTTGVLTIITGAPKVYLSIIKIIEITKRWKTGKLNEMIDKALREDE